ncbi:hypothetical protein [Paenibacillus dakarensis]|uniref:hypothetical protein n=1 Tax=Paenibacillus dakarensis TaxID=1527293 RepID=UPI0006D54FDF|nr:hypothetical protein [Paenibacillus dakarensis]
MWWQSKRKEKFDMLREVYEDTSAQLKMTQDAWLEIYRKKCRQNYEIVRLQAEVERMKEALERITTGTMSQYSSHVDMLVDFKRIAKEALRNADETAQENNG